MRDCPAVSTFAEVEVWLKNLPNQMMGISTAICQTGEPYVEFLESALVRPSDVKVVEAFVANKITQRLSSYFDNKSGIIYWRTPFEFAYNPLPQVVRYDESGPDVDFVTDRKCVMDTEWIKVAGYCRVYRATCGFEGFDFSVTPRLKKAEAD